ncbi:YdeI/OmpD-associated family protein [Metabacillus sp. GX 13764]|uniref:YdeI/OmpD-associated family protein n=1 Tax=Metabacillus kandeliae TaxID=2900151 RepID=UPI001E3A3309|nr:YdeI/OmpD-associated family protein [Metabacillus kandeliae]MCD7034058.1 YdeI/OmpD-associated family protein [Metabacillus kandeliae]
MEQLDGLPLLLCSTQDDWGKWLDENYEQPKGIWLKIAKKNAAEASVSYQEALEEALCFGWIDGQKKSFDEEYYLQKFTPRRKRSVWSKVNREKAEKLLAAGKMKQSGIKEMEAAKADGRWEAAYAPQSNFEIPEDFQTELTKNSEAKAFFETLNKRNKYAMCYRIQSAKKAETRQARIRQFVEMLNNKEMLYP